tara:strand:+ start:241 stop:1689 length:1449 start_codon:yes stop_codon:yes gene_type:complete
MRVHFDREGALKRLRLTTFEKRAAATTTSTRAGENPAQQMRMTQIVSGGATGGNRSPGFTGAGIANTNALSSVNSLVPTNLVKAKTDSKVSPKFGTGALSGSYGGTLSTKMVTNAAKLKMPNALIKSSSAQINKEAQAIPRAIVGGLSLASKHIPGRLTGRLTGPLNRALNRAVQKYGRDLPKSSREAVLGRSGPSSMGGSGALDTNSLWKLVTPRKPKGPTTPSKPVVYKPTAGPTGGGKPRIFSEAQASRSQGGPVSDKGSFTSKVENFINPAPAQAAAAEATKAPGLVARAKTVRKAYRDPSSPFGGTVKGLLARKADNTLRRTAQGTAFGTAASYFDPRSQYKRSYIKGRDNKVVRDAQGRPKTDWMKGSGGNPVPRTFTDHLGRGLRFGAAVGAPAGLFGTAFAGVPAVAGMSYALKNQKLIPRYRPGTPVPREVGLGDELDMVGDRLMGGGSQLLGRETEAQRRARELARRRTRYK